MSGTLDDNTTLHDNTTLRRAYTAIDELRRRLARAEQGRQAPVAVVGLGCRFPGGITDEHTFWAGLGAGVDGVSAVPPDRWDVEEFFDGGSPRPGKMASRVGGFIQEVDLFDHAFFGISGREAASMDPQQRVALEVAWHALEQGGIDPTTLAGSRTGVFFGLSSYDYAVRSFSHPDDVNAYASTGTAHSVVPGRISYILGLRGPSIAVDTACSSSLTAIHLACQSLRAGECDTALVGGVNLMLSPLNSIAFSQFGMLSPSGQCRTFDESADGFVRGEGCGVVVLRRVDDARRDGNRIQAIVRGSAINQDGRSSGLTAPSPQAQAEVLRQALQVSGIRPEHVGFVEMHGTGTPLGDPIEFEALASVYGRDADRSCYLGSVKTNFGHLEAASGIAGFIKSVLALRNEAIPPNLHFSALSPHISFEGTSFVVPIEVVAWSRSERPRHAAVSSFGFGGSNAHVILSEAAARTEADRDDRRPQSVLALSARSEEALNHLASSYTDLLRNTPDADVPDVCFSAGTGRAALTHRIAVVGSTSSELVSRLEGAAAGRANRDGSAQRGAVFLFTGQGAQRSGMARTLYETQPTFRQVLDACSEVLRPVLDVPLTSVIFGLDGRSALINETGYAQPALFAVEYALAELWRSWGVEPAAVIGHSLGEYVACAVAGAMPWEQALVLVAQRGQLMQSLKRGGAMAAVSAGETLVTPFIERFPGLVSIAALNGPEATVITGDAPVIATICDDLLHVGVRSVPLHVSHAFHSHHVEPMLDDLRLAAERVEFSAPRIPMASGLSGKLWPWESAPDADYWCRQARSPVRFAEGLRAIADIGCPRFIEVGPAPSLLSLATACLPPDPDRLLLPSLRPGHQDWEVLLGSVADLVRNGFDIDWTGFDRDYHRTVVDLPAYPFSRTRCWYEPSTATPAGITGTTRAAGIDATSKSQGFAEQAAFAESPALASSEAAGPSAAAGKIQPGAQSDDDLLYDVEWVRESPAPDPSVPPQLGRRTVLLLGDSLGVASTVAAALAGGTTRCVIVEPGERYAYSGHGRAQLHLGTRADLDRLLADLDLAADEDLDVVHLCSLDRDPSADVQGDELVGSIVDWCRSATTVAQVLASQRRSGANRLRLVTRGAVSKTDRPSTVAGATTWAVAEGTLPAVAAASLWGLGRAMRTELPSIWGGLVDLDPEDDAEAASEHLVSLIGSRRHEDELAIRTGVWLCSRLRRTELRQMSPAAPPWRADATYLVTGGLGALGLAVARSMVGAGARRLLLLGRSTPPPRTSWSALDPDDPWFERITAVRELESMGASVSLASVDLADTSQVGELLSTFTSEGWPPLRGVVHAAGVLEPASLLELDPEALRRQVAAKVGGAWALHQLLKDQPLDFFVLFSSASAVLSSPFLGAYAAANASLDALAHVRRHQGLPAMSINWGLWGQTGLAERERGAFGQARRGLEDLPPARGVQILQRLMGQDVTQVAVLPMRWDEWAAAHAAAARSPFVAGLVNAAAVQPQPGHAADGLPTRAELLAQEPDARLATLTAHLSRSISTVLQVDDIDVDQPLSGLGLDSLMAVELKNNIESALAVPLPIAVLMDNASVRRLAEHICDELSARGGGAPMGVARAPIGRAQRATQADLLAAVLDEVESLSQEAVDAESREYADEPA